jgi:hypothetical protein
MSSRDNNIELENRIKSLQLELESEHRTHQTHLDQLKIENEKNINYYKREKENLQNELLLTEQTHKENMDTMHMVMDKAERLHKRQLEKLDMSLLQYKQNYTEQIADLEDAYKNKIASLLQSDSKFEDLFAERFGLHFILFILHNCKFFLFAVEWKLHLLPVGKKKE